MIIKIIYSLYTLYAALYSGSFGIYLAKQRKRAAAAATFLFTAAAVILAVIQLR